MTNKRTLDGFFARPAAKRSRLEEPSVHVSEHPTYPFPIPKFPPALQDSLGFAPAAEGRIMRDQPDLDIVYYQPYIPRDAVADLFEFLRQELGFYRVQYSIKRGSVETQINTPRYTCVWGIDATSKFDSDGKVVDAKTSKPVPADRYKCQPRPLPDCLEQLRVITEGSTDCTYNFCLVNYYASGNDSISYHSDDERFLGSDPAIASLSLGATRDFLLKHKPVPPTMDLPGLASKPLKLPLASGDMVLMRGRTQSHWLHSIPKRKGGGSEKGRINITFRKALVAGGTENYYRYNVGSGPVHKWDKETQEMRPWAGERASSG